MNKKNDITGTRIYFTANENLKTPLKSRIELTTFRRYFSVAGVIIISQTYLKYNLAATAQLVGILNKYEVINVGVNLREGIFRRTDPEVKRKYDLCDYLGRNKTPSKIMIFG